MTNIEITEEREILMEQITNARDLAANLAEAVKDMGEGIDPGVIVSDLDSIVKVLQPDERLTPA